MNTIGVAVVGVGRWGPNLVRTLSGLPQWELRWVIDLDRAGLERLRPQCPDTKFSLDLDRALGDPRTQAVVVATPTSTHYVVARRALLAGKHVFVEKAMTNDVGQAAELVALAEARGLTLIVGHVVLYNAAVRQVRDEIVVGTLGVIRHISMVRTSLGRGNPDVGASWDLASHDIAMADYWLEAEATSVSALATSSTRPGVENTVFATLRYPADVSVDIYVSRLDPRRQRNALIVGENRSIQFDDTNAAAPLSVYESFPADRESPSSPDLATTHAVLADRARTGAAVPRNEPLRAECEAFLESIRTGEPASTQGRVGLSIVETLDAIARSMRHGGREEPVVRGSAIPAIASVTCFCHQAV